ncbi:VWA domain-containing protein [Shigella flexneri]
MSSLNKGQKVNLDNTSVVIDASKFSTVDHSLFIVDDNNKLISDDYMIFYGQLSTPCNGVVLKNNNQYHLELSKLPSNTKRLVLTINTPDEKPNDNLSTLAQTEVSFDQYSTSFSGKDLGIEKALLVLEVYKHNDKWKAGVILQGFNGGLADLVRYFGAEVEGDAPSVEPAKPAEPPKPTISLSKQRLISLEKSAPPKLISLAKQVSSVLDRFGLDNHTADVALVLDFSGSMSSVYRNGFVQKIADSLMGAAVLFDDNQSIDVFLFDDRSEYIGELTPKQFDGQISKWEKQYGLGGGTRYGAAMKLVMEHYLGSSRQAEQPMNRDKPIYVLFLTDGDASDKSHATKMIREASYAPIFWQFVGVNTGWGSSFDYLEKLDDLDRRFIDNADFFPIDKPNNINQDELFNKMFTEYPSWLKEARKNQLIK